MSDEDSEDIHPLDAGRDFSHVDDEYIRPDGTPRGNPRPTDGKCNALLNDWRNRYGEPRYCTRTPRYVYIETNIQTGDATEDDLPDHTYCHVHRNRHNTDMRAEEVLKTGLNAKSRDHLYGTLPAHERVIVHGTHESLMGDSTFEFAPEYHEKQFDFTDSPIEPDISDQSGPVYEIEVAQATEKLDREIALWAAAVDSVKMSKAQKEIWEAEMQVESTEHADFTTSTVPSEDGGEPKAWQTITELNEHHLNLPYSRLVRDRAELLKYGGVEVEGETSDDRAVLANIEALQVPDRAGQDNPISETAREGDLEIPE